MNLDRYKGLKTKIRDKSFEINFKKLDWGFFRLSFLGNAGAIFFAFFLLNPALQKTISQHLADNLFFQIVGIVLAIIILVGVEYLKRSVFKIFVDEFIQNAFSVAKSNVFALLLFSTLIFGASFYLSISGGIQFSKLSEVKNEIVVKSNKQLFDSLTITSEKSKEPVILEISNLRESNVTLRDKRDNTPLNYRAARNEYNKLIDDNEAAIAKKQSELKQIDVALAAHIDTIKKSETQQIKSNEESDFSSIFLFVVISTFSELLIIGGLYFRELYEHKSFYENENRLDPILKKREKYEYLLRVVYKNGDVKSDETVISLKKLSDIMISKGAQYPPKVVSDFYTEMSQLGAFKVSGNKRYAMVSYNEAKNMVESLQS